MVQPVENWADVSGSVVQLHELAEDDPFVEAEIHVDAVMPVPGFANLFAWAPGQQIRVRIPRDHAHRLGLETGQWLECRVQKSGPQQVYTDTEHIRFR